MSNNKKVKKFSLYKTNTKWKIKKLLDPTLDLVDSLHYLVANAGLSHQYLS